MLLGQTSQGDTCETWVGCLNMGKSARDLPFLQYVQELASLGVVFTPLSGLGLVPLPPEFTSERHRSDKITMLMLAVRLSTRFIKNDLHGWQRGRATSLKVAPVCLPLHSGHIAPGNVPAELLLVPKALQQVAPAAAHGEEVG